MRCWPACGGVRVNRGGSHQLVVAGSQGDGDSESSLCWYGSDNRIYTVTLFTASIAKFAVMPAAWTRRPRLRCKRADPSHPRVQHRCGVERTGCWPMGNVSQTVPRRSRRRCTGEEGSMRCTFEHWVSPSRSDSSAAVPAYPMVLCLPARSPPLQSAICTEFLLVDTYTRRIRVGES